MLRTKRSQINLITATILFFYFKSGKIKLYTGVFIWMSQESQARMVRTKQSQINLNTGCGILGTHLGRLVFLYIMLLIARIT